MSEANLWTYLRKKVALQGRWVRVENRVGPGTPDVYYIVDGISGWLELKQTDAWPAREDTIVKFDHFTFEQKDWLEKENSRGGRVHVLVQIGNEYLLFPCWWAIKHLGKAPKASMLGNADWYAKGSINVDTFIKCLVHDKISVYKGEEHYERQLSASH